MGQQQQDNQQGAAEWSDLLHKGMPLTSCPQCNRQINILRDSRWDKVDSKIRVINGNRMPMELKLMALNVYDLSALYVR